MSGAGQNPLYIVLTWVPRRQTLAIGSLGDVVFERGWYAYVGSAKRAREARVARHLARDKPSATAGGPTSGAPQGRRSLRWHADHLFAGAPARRAWLIDTGLSECGLAGALARLPGAERHPPRFGAGDCSCAGHLVRLRRRPRRADLRLLAGDGTTVSAFHAPD